MKRWCVMMLVACLCAASASAQDPEVDRAEVLRLGDLVQHIDGIQSDPDNAFVEAMGPPASDADKWFISVLTMQGCGACQRLKADWTTDQWLLALADPQDPKRSWAHYNVYPREDRSQSFRFEQVKVTAYPTVLVQPPRNGRYGESKTVVFQGTYGGDPQALARQITSAIRQYVSKFEAAQPLPSPPPRALAGSVGLDPPWQPTPQVDPPWPGPAVFPDGRPLIPPSPNQDDAQPASGWGTAGEVAATSILTLLLTLGVPWALRTYRQYRIDSGQRPLLNDEQFQHLLDTLSAVTSAQNVRSAKTDQSSAAGEPSGK